MRDTIEPLDKTFVTDALSGKTYEVTTYVDSSGEIFLSFRDCDTTDTTQYKELKFFEKHLESMDKIRFEAIKELPIPDEIFVPPSIGKQLPGFTRSRYNRRLINRVWSGKNFKKMR